MARLTFSLEGWGKKLTARVMKALEDGNEGAQEDVEASGRIFIDREDTSAIAKAAL